MMMIYTYITMYHYILKINVFSFLDSK